MLGFFAQHIYLSASLVSAVLWVFVINKVSIPRKVILMGIVFGIGSMFLDRFFALSDYWSPVFLFGKNFPIESFLYGFFFGGVLTGLYESLHKPKRYALEKTKPLLTPVVSIMIIAVFYVCLGIFHLNSIVPIILPPFFVGIIVIIYYPHLLKHLLISMLYAIILTFIGYQLMLLLDPNLVTKMWMLNNISGIFFVHVPLEEYLFGAALGFGAPFFYEVVKGKIPYWK
jgi:hypothetical protein